MLKGNIIQEEVQQNTTFGSFGEASVSTECVCFRGRVVFHTKDSRLSEGSCSEQPLSSSDRALTKVTDNIKRLCHLGL